MWGFINGFVVFTQKTFPLPCLSYIICIFLKWDYGSCLSSFWILEWCFPPHFGGWQEATEQLKFSFSGLNGWMALYHWILLPCSRSAWVIGLICGVLPSFCFWCWLFWRTNNRFNLLLDFCLFIWSPFSFQLLCLIEAPNPCCMFLKYIEFIWLNLIPCLGFHSLLASQLFKWSHSATCNKHSL